METSSKSAESFDSAPPPTGAQIFLESLFKQNIRILFGYPGAAVVPFFDRLYDGPIRCILCRHEQGAVHMADAYARSSGQIGAVVATSGPGATNLTTGLATAMKDSVPILAVTGQVRRDLIGTDAFQEVDILGISGPVTKYCRRIMNAGEMASAVREATNLARTGRPGPVLLDIPADVWNETADYPGPACTINTSLQTPNPDFSWRQ